MTEKIIRIEVSYGKSLVVKSEDIIRDENDANAFCSFFKSSSCLILFNFIYCLVH